MTFHIGDIVKLCGCSGKQEVVHVGKGVISTKYLNTRHRYYDRPARDFELVTPKHKPQASEEDFKMDHTTLFQTKEEKPRYGNYIATNPEGRIVLAMDTGYEDFDENEIVEVLPHTVEIVLNNGNTHHYAIPAGKLEVDDLVVTGIQLGRVTKLDTRVRHPKPEPKDLRKVSTLKIS